MSTIGIDQVVSPRLVGHQYHSAARPPGQGALGHLHQGGAGGGHGSHGPGHLRYRGQAPAKISMFPKAPWWPALSAKRQIIIPTGDSVIEPDDRIIIFATREAIPRSRKSWPSSWSIFDALALYPEHRRRIEHLSWPDHGLSPGLELFYR